MALGLTREDLPKLKARADFRGTAGSINDGGFSTIFRTSPSDLLLVLIGGKRPSLLLLSFVFVVGHTVISSSDRSTEDRDESSIDRSGRISFESVDLVSVSHLDDLEKLTFLLFRLLVTSSFC
jgi:hypothetical protein